MTIGTLAHAAGVPTSTVRYYERAGLLSPEQRTGSNYRAYSEQSVERLRFIRAAQSVGLSVKDIAQLLGLAAADDSPCNDVRNLLQQRLADVRQRVKELRRVEKSLSGALVSCCRGQNPGICERVQAMRKKKICA